MEILIYLAAQFELSQYSVNNQASKLIYVTPSNPKIRRFMN